MNDHYVKGVSIEKSRIMAPEIVLIPEPFCAVKRMCKYLGIHIYQENVSSNYSTIFINIILILLLLFLVLPCLAYFIRYSSDVNDAAEVLSILFPSILHLGQYFILVFTKPHLTHLFNDFEELIDQSA